MRAVRNPKCRRPKFRFQLTLDSSWGVLQPIQTVLGGLIKRKNKADLQCRLRLDGLAALESVRAVLPFLDTKPRQLATKWVETIEAGRRWSKRDFERNLREFRDLTSSAVGEELLELEKIFDDSKFSC